METANVGAYVIGVTHKPTPVLLSSRVPPSSAGMENQEAVQVGTRHCSQITHTKPHTSSLEAITPAYGALRRVGWLFFFFFFQTEAVYLWPLKDDQAEQDVVRAKQKQSWGISRQLKQTSCKCEGT